MGNLSKLALETLDSRKKDFNENITQLIRRNYSWVGNRRVRVVSQSLREIHDQYRNMFACMDGGIPGNLLDFTFHREAGSGALGGNDMDSVLRHVTNIAHLRGVTQPILTSHPDCGAGLLFARANGYNVHSTRESDEVIQHFLVDVAHKAGMGFEEIKYLDRAIDFHEEAAAHVVPQGIVTPYLREMPAGAFEITYASDADIVRTQINVAASIALGPFGWGDLFTRETPFTIAVFGYPEDSNLAPSRFLLSNMLETLTADTNRYDGRVVIKPAEIVLS